MTEDSRPPFNPFPGLRPFRSDEDYLFFGREEQTKELLGRLRRNRFVGVVGSSGSGKSSLVRCGVLSELQGGSLLEAGSDWEVAVLQPGGDPIGNLARALCEADLYDQEDPEAQPNLVATLMRSRRGLVEAARQSEMEAGSNLLVVVDQFEEVFRFHEAGRKGEEQAPDFVQLLLEAARQEEVPIYVMITMRSDFLGDCAQFAGLAEAVNEGEYLIPRLNRDQSQAAIEGPARVAGGTISRRLVQRLLNDLGDDPDQLPILQHALMRTWDRWQHDHEEGEPIDLPHYEAVGCTAEALSRHADELFASLPSERHREIARRVFKALTEKEDNKRGIRRPARLRRLCAIVAGEEDEVRTVIEAYRQPGVTFLMPDAERELQPATMIDISHESLMRIWQRLDRWVEDESQSARIYRRLRETAELYREEKAGLYHDPDLQIAQSWREASEPNEAWAEQYGGELRPTMAFLEQSEKAARQAEREREAARQRELEQANALAETQKRAARGFRRFAVGMGMLAIAAAIAFAFALRQKATAVREGENAERERENAQQSAEMAREAEASARRRQYVSDMSLVQQALVTSNYQRAKALLEQHVPEAGQADIRGWEWRYLKAQSLGNESARLGPFEEEVFSLDHSPDGRWLGIALAQGEIMLWDTESKEVVHRRQLTPLSHFAFSPSENLIALSESGSPSLSLLRIESDGTVGERQIEVGGRSGRFAFSPDGRRLAFIVNGEVQVRDLKTGEEVLPGIPSRGGFDYHGGRLVLSERVLVIATGRSLRVHSLVDGDLQFAAEHPDTITALAISPDGRYLASGIGVHEDAIRIWDLDTDSDTPVQVVEDHLAWTCWLQFTPDGRLVSSSGDQTVRVWEMNEGRIGQSQVLLGNEDEIYALSVSSDGTELVSGCKDGWIRFYDLENPRSHAQHKVYPLPDGSGFSGMMSFSADGEDMVTLGPEGRMVLIDAKSLEVTRELPGLGTEVNGVQYIGDGDAELLLVLDDSRQLTVYDVASDQVVKQRASPFISLYGSANGLAVLDGGSELSYLDPRTLEEIRAAPIPVDLVRGSSGLFGSRPIFSNGLMRWAHGSNSDPWVSVVPVEGPSPDGRGRLDLPTGSTRKVTKHSLSGDERYLATSDTSGWVALWDLHAPSPEESRRRFRPNLQTARDAQFFPSGDRLVTGGRSHDLMKVWDRESLQQLLAFGGEGAANVVIVSPDESIIAAKVDYRDASRIEFWRAPSYEELAEAISSVEEIPVRSIESLELADRFTEAFTEAVSTGPFEQVQKEWGAFLALDPWPKELQADRLVDTYVRGVVAEAERLYAAGETTQAIALLRAVTLIDLGRSVPGEAEVAKSRLMTLIEWEFPDAPVLVSKGAAWKYLDDGSDQGTAWRNPDFDDRGWKEGPAKLGYGDEAATVIDFGSDMSKHLTSYFRHQFSLREWEKDGSLKLDLLRDDGAVLYLNGREIVRSNMPAGPVTSQTEASSAVGGSAESDYYPYPISTALLSPGSNVLAAEVHQSNAKSSDLGFDLKLSLLSQSPAGYLAQLLEDAGSDSLAESGRNLLPGPLREQWMRDFKFVIVGEADGEVSDIPDYLWVRRFELRNGGKAQLETAERRLKILEADAAANANLIEAWKSRMEQAQAATE